jgi:hypothetical protein
MQTTCGSTQTRTRRYVHGRFSNYLCEVKVSGKQLTFDGAELSRVAYHMDISELKRLGMHDVCGGKPEEDEDYDA